MMELALRDLTDIIGGKPHLGTMPPLAGDAVPVGRIVTDSRQVNAGDVFWALVGPRHDGADFADEAFSRGAAGVVSARLVEPWAGRWCLHVEDTTWALWQLATVARYQFDGNVIAVTGSVGKTTTRQMLHTVLGTDLRGNANPRNFNNHIGVPLSLLQWSAWDDYAVVELGASRPGEIKALAELCEPHVGVVTRIAEAHLEGFGNQRSIAESKAELLSALPGDGCAVLNADDPWQHRIASRCRCSVLWVGRSANADVTATDIHSSGGLLSFRVDGHSFEVPVQGRHHLTSALASVAVGQWMGMDLARIAYALKQFKPLPQRCEISRIGDKLIINDTYNACPTAMTAALELLRDFEAQGRRVVICGDMAELGTESKEWHYHVGQQVVSIGGADLLVACGNFARDVVTGARDAGMPLGRAIACTTPREALPLLHGQLLSGDVVLVKGSRAMAMENIVDALQVRERRMAA